MFIQHPETKYNVVEGSTANFTCKAKSCNDCRVKWIVHEVETGTIFHPPPGNIDNRDGGHNTKLSTLHIEAVESSVVQCERYNPNTKKRHYSKFAFLHVKKSQGKLCYCCLS